MTKTDQTGGAPVELATRLRQAMRRLPGPVSIVATHDKETDKPAGMAASAVIPVAMDPPSMLIAVNRGSRCHSAIEGQGRFCINLLGTDQTALVEPFSNFAKRDERFGMAEWEYADSIPYLPAAMANLFCEVRTTLIHGTHELFVGNVYDVRSRDDDGLDPLGWMEGSFARFGLID
ncbi:flavin reductase family protein [Pontixanthobacter aestiaquae]|uniref:Flavin reductase n=1 Tax=Pontixanthobacter aestiaquae TaxID=1509367 RepID=A0A844ZAJ3_9SPHN|nr:flavin reductase family protein [Pontixanthobacter aestiaquae]MDN3644670.1 flavin reductase family protein [Pontixanthobacter aestiaquae]MXO84322.1 flavin reductase [Pontixanthobacter aestiaquae]